MENLPTGVIIACFLLIFYALAGFPYFTVKKMYIDFKKPDSEEIKTLRRKRIDIDMKFQIFNGLENVKKSFDELYKHRKMYDIIISYLRIDETARLVVSDATEAFKKVSAYMKKGPMFYKLKFIANGKNKLSLLHDLLDEYIPYFNHLKELESSLKCIRLDYEGKKH